MNLCYFIIEEIMNSSILLERGMCKKIETPNIELLYIIGKHLFEYETGLFS